MENNLNICKNEQHWILAIFLVPVIPSSHTLESPSSQKPMECTKSLRGRSDTKHTSRSK